MNQVPDRQLEPRDNSLAELAAEQAEADAWQAFLDDGDFVPVLEDYVSEDEGEASALLRAYRLNCDGAMLEVARKMAAKLEYLAEGYIHD